MLRKDLQDLNENYAELVQVAEEVVKRFQKDDSIKKQRSHKEE